MTDTPHTEEKPNSTNSEKPAAPTADEQLAAAKQEATTAQERYLRAVADLENYRRRTVRERDELAKFATAGLVEDLLPVLDNLALGLAAARQNEQGRTIAEGVAMVLEQCKSVLAKNGVQEINPAGASFDPHQHECISHLPSPTVPAEHVMEVVRLGYSLNGRLLRPASVVVSSGPAPAAAS